MSMPHFFLFVFSMIGVLPFGSGTIGTRIFSLSFSSHSAPDKQDRIISCQLSPVAHLNKSNTAWPKFWKLLWRFSVVSELSFIFPNILEKLNQLFQSKLLFCLYLILVTCIPTIAYKKNNMAIRRQTYGRALIDCINVQSSIRIVALWRKSLIKRVARNKRKKPMFNLALKKIKKNKNTFFRIKII